MSSSCSVLVRALAALTLAAACGHEQTPTPKAPTNTAQGTQANAPKLTSAIAPKHEVATGKLDVSDEILDACKIHIDNVTDAPKFDFDKSDLMSEDRSVLSQVAQCFTTGPLKGRSIDLVGRADPRGEEEYNYGLGAQRAGSVSRYLKDLGVEATKIHETSRGELDATGVDEEGWKLDRRVDIKLAR